jgi:hypothetical protein
LSSYCNKWSDVDKGTKYLILNITSKVKEKENLKDELWVQLRSGGYGRKEKKEGSKKDKNNIGRRKEKDSAISQTSVCSQ